MLVTFSGIAKSQAPLDFGAVRIHLPMPTFINASQNRKGLLSYLPALMLKAAPDRAMACEEEVRVRVRV